MLEGDGPAGAFHCWLNIEFWSAISLFPGGAFNLRTVTFKDRGFSSLCNDFHVVVWVASSKEINSIFLHWKRTEKQRDFIDFLLLVLGALVKQSMEVNFSASQSLHSHFQGHKLRKMQINIFKKCFWLLDLATARFHSALTALGYVLLEMNYKLLIYPWGDSLLLICGFLRLISFECLWEKKKIKVITLCSQAPYLCRCMCVYLFLSCCIANGN